MSDSAKSSYAKSTNPIIQLMCNAIQTVQPQWALEPRKTGIVRHNEHAYPGPTVVVWTTNTHYCILRDTYREIPLSPPPRKCYVQAQSYQYVHKYLLKNLQSPILGDPDRITKMMKEIFYRESLEHEYSSTIIIL